jgi:serine/threonine-protein kinase
LPRRRAASPSQAPERPRFDRVRLLGEGGMGQVELVKDNDIRRTVAVKRLHSDIQSEEALLRFADEVRIVGQLEHPAIVPVYDVGRDESGQVYLVMKHLSGETMEQIIAKLRSNDPTYVAQYSIDYRVHLFLAVLDALRFAHSRGVIHRDIKPANIMIGPYGEVTVLDWGIAKPIRRKEGADGAQALDRTAVDTKDSRLQETQLGSLAGTPLYMSPEQAAGNNDALDARSDLYAACVVFHEMLQLRHRFADAKNVVELLNRILTTDPPPVTRICLAHPAQPGGVPPELGHFLVKGLQRDPEKRWQTAEIMITELHRILDGDIHVQCMATFAKKSANVYRKLVDRNPGLAISMMLASAVTFIGMTAYVIADLAS